MPYSSAQLTNVYHECQRCGVVWPLAQMRWQNGKLLCYPNGCVDTAIIGSRDLAVAKAVSIDRKELIPDPKLVNPTDRRDEDIQVLF